MIAALVYLFFSTQVWKPDELRDVAAGPELLLPPQSLKQQQHLAPQQQQHVTPQQQQ